MSSSPPSHPSLLPQDSWNLEQAFKQFFLETERLTSSYRRLEERFTSVHVTIQETNTRLSGKLAELDFVSRYVETILQNISQGILFIDMKGIVTTYNEAAQQILKIDKNELLFHSFTEFFEDCFFGFSLAEAFVSKEAPKTLFVSWNRDKQVVELEIEAIFVSTHDQSYSVSQREFSSTTPIQGLLIIVRDITKLRMLQQSANRIDRLHELGELAAHLAHEIRNPLGGIKGFASILQQELKERPDLQGMASSIAQGADELNVFVSNILQYARPFHIQMERVDLIHLIADIQQFLQADSAWNPSIEFTCESSVTPLFASIDPQLFKSALLNLFVNAIQAMPNGGKLSIHLEENSQFISLCIVDTGIGIAKENLDKIFSPFFTTKETGNGLGLAEVQKVIQAHQGSIHVQSQEGQGTTFTIKIPRQIGE